MIVRFILALSLLTLACQDPPVPSGESGKNTGEGEGEEEHEQTIEECLAEQDDPFAVSTKADLRWKRLRQLQNDLMVAMQLTPADVCSEIGLDGLCFDLIHLVPLGGNEPVKSGMYRPIAQPGVTTALSFDRVVLSACGRRVDVDTVVAADQRVLWRTVDLDAASLSADDAGLRTDLGALVRALLGRDATAAEVDRLASLTDDVDGEDVSARDVAKMACYAVGTSSEFLFD